MAPINPPEFDTIADADTKRAFLHGRPEVVESLASGTKLFKWTQSITTSRGVSAWWQFLLSRRLKTGTVVPGIREQQEYASRLGAPDRDYARARLAVTEQWNKMTQCVAIELVNAQWGYVGKASGQPKNKSIPVIYFIGGEYQVWIPGLVANDIRQIAILPFLTPNAPFGAR